ncbi:MAG: ABC transporter ATP-binding protein [Spirochaetales bacterium]
MTGEVVADVYQPLLMARIVDHGIKTGDLGFVLTTGVRMVTLAFLGLLGGVGCTVLSSYTSQSVGADVRKQLYAHVQSLSLASLDQLSPQTLITRLTNDTNQVQTFVLMMLRMMVRAPLLFIGGTIMIFLLSPDLLIVLSICYGFLFVGMGVVISRGLPLFQIVQEKLDEVNRVVRENLAGIRLIKAYVQAKYEQKRFEKVNVELRDATVRVSELMSGSMPLFFLTMNLCIVIVLWIGGQRVNRGALEVGKVIAIITYLTQILHSLMMVAFLLVTLARVKASIKRIEELLALKSEPYFALPGLLKSLETESQKHVSIEFQQVTFKYEESGAEPVLQEVSFQVPAGTTLGLLGPTGAGKSTILFLLLRFFDPLKGQILLNGIPTTSISLTELRKKIGWVMQAPLLFTGTIKENLLWGIEGVNEKDLQWATQLAQAEEFILNLPEGFDTPIGRRGVNLSGGQKQRLSLARALLRRPSLLLLDDATSAVDLSTEAAIQEGLRTLKETTVLIVTQRISSVLPADSILLLDKGKVAGWGTHRDLLQNNPLYQEIYQIQVEEGGRIAR